MCGSALGDHGEAAQRDPADPEPIYGGEPAGPCEFPSTVSLGSCTATLVHPEMVVYAAHCGTNYSGGFLGDDTDSAGKSISFEYCSRHPNWNGIGTGTDFAYCKLTEPVTGVAFTPPLMGCEVDVLTEGREVWIVGFGENDDGGYGRKYKAQTTFNYFDNVGDANIGGGGTTICFGDSGGPTFVKLPAEMGFDGSWRAFGIASYVYTPCGNEGFHSVMHRGTEWMEEDSGIDITPCHDADGTWNPTEACNAFPLTSDVGAGSWDTACEMGDLSGWGSTCGRSYPELTDQVPPMVRIASHESGDELNTDPAQMTAALTVAVEASDGESGVREVSLMVDGSEVGGVDAEPPYEYELNLAEGEYELIALAVDEADNAANSDPITITIVPEPVGGDETGESEGGEEGEDGDSGGSGAAHGGALPPSYGDEDGGCGCTAAPRSGWAAVALLLLLLGIRRRSARRHR